MTQLIQSALDAAWEAFQNTTIDLLADSDDETRRCLNNAIATYVVATERTNKIAAPGRAGASIAANGQRTVPAEKCR